MEEKKHSMWYTEFLINLFEAFEYKEFNRVHANSVLREMNNLSNSKKYLHNMVKRGILIETNSIPFTFTYKINSEINLESIEILKKDVFFYKLKGQLWE